VKDKIISKYLLCAIIFAIISTAYWSAFAVNAYNSYHDYSDVGVCSYDMYFHVNYPSIVHGLQYLIFCNHVSPDSILLFLPAFAAFPSAVTLLVLQAIVVSFTGLAVFMISRKLLSNERTAFLLFLAFLLNPGVIALLVFDFHLEVLIPLFMLLTFYFFVEKTKAPFFVSALLLLGTIEVVAPVALMLGVGFIFYAVHAAQGKKIDREYLVMAAALIIMAAVAAGLYAGVYSTLTHAYASGNYPGLPIILKDIKFFSGNSSYFASLFTNGRILIYYIPLYATCFALAIVFFSFGIGAIFEFFILLLLSSPWLANVLLFQNSNFVNLFNQYFAFALGGTMIATLMSLIMFKEKTERFYRNWRFRDFVKPYVDYTIVISLVVLLLVYLFIILSTNVESLRELLLLRVGSPQEHVYDQQLSSLISAIPANASVMAPYFVMPHLMDREKLEIIQGYGQNYSIIPQNALANRWNEYDAWFAPDYVVEDSDQYTSNTPLTGFGFGNTVNDSILAMYGGVYHVYGRNGNATLLVREAG
jgi:uncharacterized membrane protein